MNSVDAGATRCEITLTDTTAQIADDGRGFRSKEEIYQWFEVFGAPQTEEKTYGRFRIGRGQLFAFGKNRWTTKSFVMEVDFKNRGDQYDLRENPQAASGCTILVEFYDKLYPSQVVQTEQDLKLWCRWMPIEVTLNGMRLSHAPGEFDWTEETPEAYVELDERPSLEVYNLGAHVKSFPKYQFGVGGEVVSKQQLQTNFARNDIMSDCAVWKKIMPLVDQKARERITRSKKGLDDAQRQRLARQAVNDALEYSEWRCLPIFTAATGRNYKAVELDNIHHKITVAPKGSRLGDMVHRQGLAFVLAKETLDRFAMGSLRELVDWLKRKSKYSYREFDHLVVVDFDQITQGMDLSYEILAAEKLTLNERIWVDLIRTVKSHLRLCDEPDLAWRGGEDDYTDFYARRDRRSMAREILVGVSQGANGWTDAASYIALNRAFLKRHALDLKGFVGVGRLLLHEACHREPDLEDHDHDQSFYELFHDSAEEFLAEFVQECFSKLPTVLGRHQKKLTRRMLQQQDQAARGQRRQEELSTVVASVEVS